jgi:uncharacterized membrane protein
MDSPRGTVPGRWIVIALVLFVAIVVAYAAYVLFFKNGGPARSSRTLAPVYTLPGSGPAASRRV